jgi:hypothetical protein
LGDQADFAATVTEPRREVKLDFVGEPHAPEFLVRTQYLDHHGPFLVTVEGKNRFLAGAQYLADHGAAEIKTR